MAELVTPYIDTLTAQQRNILEDLFSFAIPSITWDFDQIMVDTETPVKQRFYVRTGIDYRDWKIDRWLALANKAAAEGKMALADAAKIEMEIWHDPRVMAQVKPIRAVQLYSKIAFLKGVKQSVITSRESKLKDVTLNSIRNSYYWIPEENIHIRSDDSVSGDEFKGLKVGQLGSNVHIDDAVGSTQAVLNNSDATVLFFPRSAESGTYKGNQRVIELPDMSMLLSSAADFH